MRDAQSEFEDFIHSHVTSERLARNVVAMLVERWGWTICIENMEGYERQALAD
jgi:hypothetical protein